NSQRDLARLDVRLAWEDQLFKYLRELDEQKPVIYCGDLNVAHEEIDLRNAKTNRGNSGFTTEERSKMSRLLDAGFIDTLRHFHPVTEGIYTWWSYMKTVRERNMNMPLSSRQSQNRTTFFPNSPPLTLFVSMVILFQRMGKTKPSKAPSA